MRVLENFDRSLLPQKHGHLFGGALEAAVERRLYQKSPCDVLANVGDAAKRLANVRVDVPPIREGFDNVDLSHRVKLVCPIALAEDENSVGPAGDGSGAFGGPDANLGQVKASPLKRVATDLVVPPRGFEKVSLPSLLRLALFLGLPLGLKLGAHPLHKPAGSFRAIEAVPADVVPPRAGGS